MYDIFTVCTAFPDCCLAVSHSVDWNATLMLQLY